MKKQSQLSNEIKKLQYQLSYSQHINKELSHYLAQIYKRSGTPLDKLPSVSNMSVNNIRILSSNNTHLHLQQLYYIEPLLMCYEQSLYRLNEEVGQLRQHSEDILKQVDNVTKQNQFLRKQLSIKLSLLAKNDNLGIDVGFLKVEKEQLIEIKRVLQQKIEFLARKSKEIQSQLDNANRSKTKMINEIDLGRIKNSHEDQLKLLESRIIGLDSDVSILKNQLNNEKSLLKQEINKNQSLEQTISLLRNEVRLSKQNLEKHASAKQRYEQSQQIQSEAIKQQLKISIRKQQQIFNKMMGLESELQDKTNKINNLNIQNSQLQSNNNNMLQMLESYEMKVSGLNKKVKKFESQQKSTSQDHNQLIKKAQILQWKMAEKDEQIDRKQKQWGKERDRLTKVWQQRVETLRKGLHVPQQDIDVN